MSEKPPQRRRPREQDPDRTESLLRQRRRPPQDRVPPRPDDRTQVQQPTASIDRKQPAAKSKRRRSRSSSDDGLSVPWWGFALVILVVAGVTCGLWAYVLSLRSDPSAAIGPTPTPIFVIITATPTLAGGDGDLPVPVTPTLQAAQPTDAGLPPTSTAAPAAQEISVGRNVMIQGTGGDGLSMRQGPGVDFTLFFIAQDGEVFFVEDGPREGGGFTWWYIVDPDDSERAGWAVEQFMVPQP